jgi:hypothetical protein
MEGEVDRGWEPVGGHPELACMACGSPDLEVICPGRAEGLRDWLRSGGRWRPPRQVCRRCGHVTVAGSVRYLARRAGWWRVPAGLVQVLRRRRSRVPSPAIYLLAAAVGTALGAGAQLLIGWPWWLVAVGVLAAVWLGFAATALGGGGPDRSLVSDLLMVTDPAAAMRRQHRVMAEQFRASPLPLYGLPAAWPGLRHLGGWGSRQARGEPAVVTNLSLAHGDPLAAHGPQLLVEVRAEPGPGQAPEGGPALRQRLAEELGWTVAAAGDRPPEPPERDAGVAWTEATIAVDGRAARFDLLAEGRHWVAAGAVEGFLLVLQGRDLDAGEVELVRVTDVEPYVEGTRRLEEAARARALGHRPAR